MVNNSTHVCERIGSQHGTFISLATFNAILAALSTSLIPKVPEEQVMLTSRATLEFVIGCTSFLCVLIPRVDITHVKS